MKKKLPMNVWRRKRAKEFVNKMWLCIFQNVEMKVKRTKQWTTWELLCQHVRYDVVAHSHMDTNWPYSNSFTFKIEIIKNFYFRRLFDEVYIPQRCTSLRHVWFTLEKQMYWLCFEWMSSIYKFCIASSRLVYLIFKFRKEKKSNFIYLQSTSCRMKMWKKNRVQNGSQQRKNSEKWLLINK